MKTEITGIYTFGEFELDASEGAHGLAVAPDGKILFTANNSGSRTIWEMNEDATAQRQLTPIAPNSGDTRISVTPDTRFLIVESERTGAPEIWRANRDGSDLVQLTNGGGNSEPAVSPDGKSIIYKDNIAGLWRQDLDRDKPEASKGFDETRVFHFAFSPVTKKLIYSGGVEMREIVVIENFR